MEQSVSVSERESNAPLSRRELLGQIERLAIPADAKALLNRLSDVTIDIGGRVIRIGQRILAFILEAVQLFPNTAFGVVAAFVVSTLIAAIPLFGPVLAPLLTPLILAFGVATGALADLREGALRTRLHRLEEEFSALMRAA